jgi:hypothetical protein
MDANELRPQETVSASRKLGRDAAEQLLAGASKLMVAKGKNVRTWKLSGKPPAEAVDAMLGPTGNLRAPTLRVGKTIVVGFDAEMFESVFGAR